jgi:hypothetical protein
MTAARERLTPGMSMRSALTLRSIIRLIFHLLSRLIVRSQQIAALPLEAVIRRIFLGLLCLSVSKSLAHARVSRQARFARHGRRNKTKNRMEKLRSERKLLYCTLQN